MAFLRRPVIALLFLFALLVSGRQLSSPDLGWHLAAGERIVREGRIPDKDDFSHTVEGNHWWVNQPLSELLFYGVLRFGGPPALIVLRMAVVGSIFLVLLASARLGRRENEFLTAGVLLLALLASTSHMLVRPFLLSALGLAATAYAAEAYRRRRWKGFYGLPALFAVWAHVHPGFLYGAAVLGAYVLGEWARSRFPFLRGDLVIMGHGDRRRFLFVSIGSFAAALLSGAIFNPSGVDALLLPLGLMKTGYFFTVLNEFQPAHPIRDRFFSILGLLTVLSFLPRGRRDASEILVVLIFGIFASRAVRVILPFAVVAAPIAVRNLEAYAERLLPAGGRRSLVLRGLAAAAVVYFGTWWWKADPYRTPLPRDRGALGDTWPWARVNYPIRAFRFMEKENLPGEVFHVDRYGGPFILHFYPERKDFIDGRVEVYGEEFWRDVYFPILLRAPGWEALLRKYDVNTLLLMIGSPFSTDPISHAVPELSSWVLVYFDDDAMIYVRRSSLDEERVSMLEMKGVRPATGASPGSYEEEILARSSIERAIEDGRSQRALLYGMEMDALRKEWKAAAGAPNAYLIVRGKAVFRFALYLFRGEARFRGGDLGPAEEDWKKAGGSPAAKNDLSLLAYLRGGPVEALAPAGEDRAAELARLAGLLSEAGRHEKASDVSREALRIGGGRPDFRNGLAWALLQGEGREEEALGEARSAVREMPRDGYARGTLALALRRTGDREGARRAFEEAIRLLPAEDYRASAADRGRLARLLAEGESPGEREEGARWAAEALRIDPETEEAAALTRFLLGEGRAETVAALSLRHGEMLNRADLIRGRPPIEDRGRYIYMEALKDAGFGYEEIERQSTLYTPRSKSRSAEGGETAPR
ncbi:MAG: hypothetical protein ABIK65_05055 [Candidatus Eisenbacteria bacterium]